MKSYKLTAKTTMVVMANNSTHAEIVARENRCEIERDSAFDLGPALPVNSLSDLPDNWDEQCIPYGGDGNTPLKDLLPKKSEMIGCVGHDGECCADREHVQKDAARYRWLKDRLIGADFNWNETGECVLLFNWPETVPVCSNCDKNIDAAMMGVTLKCDEGVQ